jgi:hypothetical protein
MRAGGMSVTRINFGGHNRHFARLTWPVPALNIVLF